MDAILRQAQEKALQKARSREREMVRDKKTRAEKIERRRQERNLETRKVKIRNGKDKAELILQECAPIILRHLDTHRCDECFEPIPDAYFADELPEGERRPEKCENIINQETGEVCGRSYSLALKRGSRGLDGVRIVMRCSKTDLGAFSASIMMSGDKPDKARNYPTASLRALADKNDWQNKRLIEWLMRDDRTTAEVDVIRDGKRVKETRLLGYNCRSVPEMLEEIIRLRKRTHFLEDELAAARKPARKCASCEKDMDDAEVGDICIDCNLKGKGEGS